MPRQFFDLTREERSAERDHEIMEAIEDIHESLEDVFALVLSLSLAAASLPRRAQP